MKTCVCGRKTGDSHSQCLACRSTERQCVECSRTFVGARRRCGSCASVQTNEKQRDKRMGLQPGQFDQMLADQGGLCAICFRSEKMVRAVTQRVTGLSTDHDHMCCPGSDSCGQCVRGLVCRNCNTLLGMAEDNILILQSAISYLTKFAFLRDQASVGNHSEPQVGHPLDVAVNDNITQKGK